MNRQQLIDLMFQIASKRNAFDELEDRLADMKPADVMNALVECGILPETFAHDSSEEKLWAKYSDILLSKALNLLGFQAEVIRTRGDSADVFARSPLYSIVGDAKTFRLSRTAKNQKDFKVKALDDWRRSNDYAVLVGPLSQFPTSRSQIYQQAIERNVTLISYTHLTFLLKTYRAGMDLSQVWQVGMRLSEAMPLNEHKHAVPYWREVDRSVCGALGQDVAILTRFKTSEWEITRRLGMEGIAYWEEKITEYQLLSREDAVRLLIKADKIDNKIEQIKKAISQDQVP
ncbi:MAG: HindIII family type II restriction endonuclease [Anaerolineae bacterium]